MQNVIERLLNLLAFLLTAERPVSADEIRRTVAGYDQATDDAYRRMFERDKDLLRQLGVPIQLRPTDGWEVEHGYLVERSDYSLPDPGLTDEERTALWLAAQVVRIGGSAAGPDALFKLGGAPLSASGEPLAADLGTDDESLAAVFVSVSERRTVSFHYRDIPRTVYPYGLVHRRGHWYLVGPETDDLGTVKAFRVDRATALTAGELPDRFERPPGFRASDQIPEAPWEAGGDDLKATIRIDAELAWWADRQLTGRESVVRLDDGSIEATLPVANVEAFIGWILAFDDHAVILEPESLRRRLLERIGVVS